LSDDERKALDAADALLTEHGIDNTSERFRSLLALAYLTGTRDGMSETKALADAAFARLAADLSAAVKS
jgi:hypothetical protein